MAADNVNKSLLPVAGQRYAVLLGSAIVILTTTVPYLTMVNIFLFAGIFFSGTIALYRTILRFQVRLSYRDAFFVGCLVGLVGGIASEGITFLLMNFFNYRPGTESLAVLIAWVTEMAKGKPELQEQVRQLVAAEKLALSPVSLSFTDILMNMLFSGAFYAPIAGLGGVFAVLRLKRKASRG